MYSNIRSVQILISLLKEFDVKDIVLSPGGSDIPLIHSIETDSYFKCYSVVDERSAAYFAMGVAQAKQVKVACICTSGSAVCNYLPGITEAYYQSVPVIAITADKNPYYQGQLETQKINQMPVFSGVVKKAVELPIVNNSQDEWLCNRLVNEALLATEQHGTGPVHINIPIVGATNVYNCETLPKERRIYVNKVNDDERWEKAAKRLAAAKRILVVVGQNVDFSDECLENMNCFFEKYNCVYAVEHLSNLESEGKVYTYPVTEMAGVNGMRGLVPDVVISLGNNLAAYQLKPFLRENYKRIQNWLVSESGEVRDAYKCLTDIFECSEANFFEKMVEKAPKEAVNSKQYFADWNSVRESLVYPDYEFSNFYVAKKLASVIPENSILHLAILNSTRIMQFFELRKGIKTYSNVGTLGIDGCFSTFCGQAATTDELAFLVIGDLSFFYDMNAAGIREISSNVRVVLLNNSGGSEFHFFMGRDNIETIDEYICAEHKKTAEGWIKSLGYDYYSARSKEDVDRIMEVFGQKSDRPMFLEVFTEMEEDAVKTREMYKTNQHSGEDTATWKKMVTNIVGEKRIGKAIRIMNVIKE